MGVQFTKLPIPRQLAGLTDRIMHVEYGTDAFAQAPDSVVGSARINLLVSLRGGLLEGECEERLERLPRVSIMGPWVRGRVWQPDGHTEVLLIQLNGAVVRSLCGVHPGDLRNVSESLAELTRSRRLIDALEGADSSPQKILEALARERISRDVSTVTAEQHGFDTLILARYGWRVKNYADPMGVSVRTLERRMQDAFGVTPKQLLDTGRMNRLVRLTEPGWERRVSDLAAELGYFDQSHMNQDIARLNMGPLPGILRGGHKIGEPDRLIASVHAPAPGVSYFS